MTVEELIMQLQKFPSKNRVVVRGYESGYNDIQLVREIGLLIDHSDLWYYGAHEEAKEGQKIDEPAVLLFGENTNAEDP